MFTQDKYNRGDAIAISWHIEDVKAIDNDLTDEQARKVLANFAKHHDGSMEQMWVDLEYHVGEFKKVAK